MEARHIDILRHFNQHWSHDNKWGCSWVKIVIPNKVGPWKPKKWLGEPIYFRGGKAEGFIKNLFIEAAFQDDEAQVFPRVWDTGEKQKFADDPKSPIGKPFRDFYHVDEPEHDLKQQLKNVEDKIVALNVEKAVEEALIQKVVDNIIPKKSRGRPKKNV